MRSRASPMYMAHSARAGATRTIGVDTGGTFTDLVALCDGKIEVAKLASTPRDPARAVVAGVRQLGGPLEHDHVVHGTTVALNALLTGRVARAAFVTQTGLADALEIGRQDRPELYALHPTKPAPVVPRERIFEVDSRVWPRLDGRGFERVSRPTRRALRELAAKLARARVESIAIGLLHSYADAEGEREVARALKALGVPLTLSGELLPEHREVERFSTAVVNAALAPIVREYLAGLAARLEPARLSVMQSSGGTIAAERASRESVRVLLSGPAGGVIGAARAAREAGFERMVGFDMGGTSTDVAFHGARTRLQGVARRIAGHPVAVPMLDIHTIGCGGGSIASVDAGGVLHVGPESAGADPGPVCYGKSDRPTLTDAHVMLGHVATGKFLDGELALDVDAVQRAFEKLGARLGLSPHDAAGAVIDVARAGVRRALSVMTMQRGEDPRRVPLVAFGGAGGLHAAALAASLAMPCALVPRFAGLLSAFGMATADALAERTSSVLAPLARWSKRELDGEFHRLARAASEELASEGHARRSIEIESSYDLRYLGQSFELGVARAADPMRAFHAAHQEVYGFRLEGREVELVALRVRAVARCRVAAARPVAPSGRSRHSQLGERAAWFPAERRPRRASVYDETLIGAGEYVLGPALVEAFSGTTLVPPGWRARSTSGAHLLLESD